MLNSKKGLSPILATLLLIVIAVAAIVAAYAWIMTYMGNVTQQAGVMLYEANVSFVPSSIVIAVGNSGTSDTRIVAVYIGTSDTNMQSYTPTYESTSAVSAGAIVDFNVTFTWTAGRTYYFKIVPVAGQQALTFQEQAPQSSVPTSPNWWNSQYGYRQLVTIINNEASTLPVGYSAEIDLDTASLVSGGEMSADCSDLRIVYLNGSSWVELDRDIINNDTSLTQVWFKTQAPIGASPSADTNYYLYYGNHAGSNPPANRSNVYLWFDDFNRADNPDVTSESVYAKTSGGTWSIESGMLKNTGEDGDPNKLVVYALGTVNYGVEMFARLNITTWLGEGDKGRMGLSCCMDTPEGEGYCGLLHNDLNTVAMLNDLRSWGSDTMFSWTTNTGYCMRFRVTDPSTQQGDLKIWLVGTPEPANWTLSGNFGGGDARGYGEVGVAGSRRADITYFDNFQIRYAADSEPTINLGSQETPH
jgi:flagellin-like protein